ncbi:MAG: Rrf2 family transcriptional regulator [Spirochaetaceae bacterium]|jgi:Rrf2 family protein|nr:Rrf2 family transcriptional regulator [Spirochaetaceae bacterium]GMO18307.1 MAG: Rrf2 family transcriptional regulator [Termitinemataceae bacterium]
MKISSRGRYGIRLLIDLAEHGAQGHITLSSVAARQNVSVRYLEQVAIILRRAGIIRSIKGAQGGYALSKKPEEIIVGDVLRSLEGDMLIADPPLASERETKYSETVRRVVFERLNQKIASIIDSQTLASLAGVSQKEYMYFI